MWFKQTSLFQFSRPFKINQSELSDALAPLSFTPCLPSLPSSVGWVSPIDAPNSPLVYGNARYWMLCLQFEEKILPSAVIKQALEEKAAEIALKEGREVRGKQKQNLKDEIIQTLLPRAFTKKTRVYAYIDVERQRLIINSSTPSKLERFNAFLKRAIPTIDIHSLETKKPTSVMTQWLKSDAPDSFQIGQIAMLQDPQQQKRVIRCQHQDLFSQSIQTLLKEGCEIAQLGLQWRDQLQFILCADFSIKRIQFQEAVLALSKSDYTETPQQRFDADFVIMTEILSLMIDDLSALFVESGFIASEAA